MHDFSLATHMSKDIYLKACNTYVKRYISTNNYYLLINLFIKKNFSVIFQYQVSLLFLKTCWDELYKIALQKGCDENLMIFS